MTRLGLLLTLLTSSIPGIALADIDDFSRSVFVELPTSPDPIVQRAATIGWANHLYYFFPRRNGTLGIKTVQVGLDNNDVPTLVRNHNRTYSGGWKNLDNLNLFPVFQGSELLLFLAHRGETTLSVQFFRQKSGRGTELSNIAISRTHQVDFVNAPSGWAASAGCAFSVGGKVFLLIGNQRSSNDFPSLFEFDRDTMKATFRGKLDALGAVSQTRPNFAESTQRYSAAHLLTVNRQGLATDTAVISYMIDSNQVAVLLFDGSQISRNDWFNRGQLGGNIDSNLLTVSVATGGSTGGPTITAPSVQLLMQAAQNTNPVTTVEFKGSQTIVRGGVEDYSPITETNNFPRGLRATSMLLPSAIRGSYRRVFVGVSPNSGFDLEVGATQSDLLRHQKTQILDTETYEFSGENGSFETVFEPENSDEARENNRKVRAFVEGFWSLLGVIAGPPPYAANLPDAMVSSAVSFVNTNSVASTTSQSSSAASVGGLVGADPFETVASLDMSSTNAFSNYVESTVSLTISASDNFGPAFDGTNWFGKLVLFKPRISIATFQAQSPNGKANLDATYTFYYADGNENANTGVVLVDFPLGNPNDPNFPMSNGMFGGAENTGWPATKGLDAWKTVIATGWRRSGRNRNAGKIDLRPPLRGSFSSNSTVSVIEDSNNTRQQSNTIQSSISWSIPFPLPFLGISGGGSSTMMQSRSQTTAFNQTLTLSGSPLVASNTDGDPRQYTLAPSLLFPGPKANWIPTDRFPNAKPWCLTYATKVLRKVGETGVNTLNFDVVTEDPFDPRYIETDFLGPLFNEENKWYFHFDTAQWMLVDTFSTPEDFYFWIGDSNWLWTTSDLFPWAIDLEEFEWTYIE